MITRRALLTGGTSAIALASMGSGALAYAPEECWAAAVPAEKPVKPEKAASITRVLTDAMMGEKPRLDMTRIDGFIMARENGKSDVVIYGRKDPKRKELRFDDIVVASRAVWGKYGKGVPAISLDSLPGYQNKKADLRDFKIKTKTMTNEEYRKRLSPICQEYTGWARINALPPDSPLTLALLAADYEMKEVGQGNKLLKIKNPPPNAFELEDVEARNERRSRLSIDVFHTPTDRTHGGRLWFESGNVSYNLEDNTAFLDVVQLVLRVMSQKMVEQKDNGIESKEDDPSYMQSSAFWRAGRKWACSITNRMDDIVSSGEPWQGIYDAYRTFALVRTLIGVKASMPKGIMELLRTTYEPEKILIPSQFPSKTYVRKHEILYKDGPKQTVVTYCGGAVMNGTPVLSRPSESTRSDVRLAGRMALDSMRSCTASCWDVQ